MSKKESFRHLGLYIKTRSIDPLQLFSVYMYIDPLKLPSSKYSAPKFVHFYRLNPLSLSRAIRVAFKQQLPNIESRYHHFVQESIRYQNPVLHPYNKHLLSECDTLEDIANLSLQKGFPRNPALFNAKSTAHRYAEFTDITLFDDHLDKFFTDYQFPPLLDYPDYFSSEQEYQTHRRLLLDALSVDMLPYLVKHPLPISSSPKISL